MSKPPFSPFPREEYDGRVVRARQHLARAGFDGAICVGPDLLNYLGGFDCVSYFSPQALILATGETREPTLFIRNADTPHAAETSWTEDIRTYQLHGEDPFDVIASIVAERGLARGRLAIDMGAYSCTGRYLERLRAALPGVTLVDATDLLSSLQFIKSPAELAHMRAAGRMAEAGLVAARERLEIGMTEIEYCGHIEAAMRAQGSEFPALPALCASGWRGPGMHSTPTGKKIERGDMIHLEFAGVHNRYHAVAIMTLAAGEPPAPARDYYDLGNETLRAGLAACIPGDDIAQIERASIEPLRRAGREDAYMVMMGTGLGVAYPPIWGGSLHVQRWSDLKIEAGMVFYLHSCLQFMSEKLGILQGGTYHVTETGIETLCGAGDVELEIIGG